MRIIEARMWTSALLVWSLSAFVATGFCAHSNPQRCQHKWQLHSTDNKQSTDDSASILELEEPAGIVGAEFFGGNKEKAEYFDPVAEAKADEDITKATTTYNRFEDTKAFDSPIVAEIGQALQSQLNEVLVGAKNDSERTLQYASNVMWESCFDTKSAKNPLAGLKEALDFYKEVNVAIIAGKQLSDDKMQLQWQVSVVWPIFWGPRVLLSGTSELTLKDGTTITRQTDTLDSSSDLVSAIADQLKPRFWDTYHIGMTPSAETMPRVERKQGFLPKSYSLFEIAPRLVSAPTQLDSAAGRVDGNAQIVPNHAFSCVIKTMGPTKQEFVPASPLQVQIMPSSNGLPRFKWSVPLSVGFAAKAELPLAGEDPEARPGSEPTCEYEFQPRRLVATLSYGGTPQDEEISSVRKKLYDNVLQDGLKPLLDGNGRPQFFFLQNGVKACYTEEGLGMCVYEWRPEAVKPNEVGIELEL